MSFWRSLFGNQRTSDAAVLVEALAEHGVSPSERAALARWLREAPAREIVHLNPRYLAEELALPTRRTLQLLAPGILTGLFTDVSARKPPSLSRGMKGAARPMLCGAQGRGL